jgi:hypothetical protein
VSVYTVHLKPDSEPVLVREGFSWLALLFGPLWLALHRAWLAAAFSLAGYVLIAVLLPAPGRAVLTIGLALLLGLTGQDLRRWSLEQRGYLLAHVFAARGTEEAFLKLLTHRPDVANRYRPEPA